MDQPASSGSTSGLKIIIGAVVLLVLPIVAFFLLSPILSTPHPVAEQLLEPYNGPFEKYKQPYEELWDASLKVYQADEFQSAAQQLIDLKSKTTLKPQQELLLGLCWIYQRSPEPAKAADHLLALSKSEGRYAEEAKWYASLAYYLSDQKSIAYSLWEEMVAESEHAFSKQSSEILKKVPAKEEA